MGPRAPRLQLYRGVPARPHGPSGDLALEMLKAKSVSSPAQVLAGVPKSIPVEFDVIERPLPLAVTILHVVFSLGEIDVMLMLIKEMSTRMT